MEEITRILQGMEPSQAAAALAQAVRPVLALLDEEGRRGFLDAMLGGPGGDKVLGMVHL